MESTQLNLKPDDFIIIDKNKILNTKKIRWIEYYDNCYEICSLTTGCTRGTHTHAVCKDSKYFKDIKNLYDKVMDK